MCSSFRIVLPDQHYATAEQKGRFFRSLLPELRALPGVSSVTETSTLPPYGGIPAGVEVRGSGNENHADALLFLISEQYFDVLNVPLFEGRPLSEPEVFNARKVAIINRTFASCQYFGSTDPLGKMVKFGFLERVPEKISAWFEIVGVVADQKNQGLEEPTKARGLHSVHHNRIRQSGSFATNTRRSPHSFVFEYSSETAGH